MTNTQAAEQMKEVTQERKEFTLSTAEYIKLPLEVQKLIDKNYWRFSDFSRGYRFSEMYPEEKAHFQNEEMVIRHSLFV